MFSQGKIEVIGGYIAGGNGSLPNGSLTDYYLGGGIYCSSAFNGRIDSCTIDSNEAGNAGGGVYSIGINTMFTNSYLLERRLSHGDQNLRSKPEGRGRKDHMRPEHRGCADPFRV